MGDRAYDVVLFGATGFTGTLTAEYLAAAVPPGIRWAIAGRSRAKLDTLRERLSTLAAPAPAPDTIVADVDDPVALRELAGSARVVATTVGPYVRYGEPLVAACADAGTDYADLTGEPEFVDLVYLRHHRTAERTGARLVHACGFDSIPHDLGAQYAVEQLPADQPIRLRGYLRVRGAVSGGTLDSAVTAFSRARRVTAVHRRRSTVEGRSTRARAVTGRPGYDRDARTWVLPLPTIDPQIVVRSAAALDRYGPDFRYTHYAAFAGPVRAAAVAAGAGSAVLLAQLPPARALLRRLRPAGTGPAPGQRARNWFSVTFLGDTPNGDHVVARVSGGDPGYDETAKMLAESALSLATDPLPETAGQVTTAVALGHHLRDRLVAAGLRFEVVAP